MSTIVDTRGSSTGGGSDARAHRSNFVRNGGIAKTNKKHHRFRHPTVVGEKIREIAELQKSLSFTQAHEGRIISFGNSAVSNKVSPRAAG